MLQRVFLCVLFLATTVTLSCHATPDPPTGEEVDDGLTEWLTVGGDRECSKYSPLTQINKDNVKDLTVAWTFHTGEVKNGKGKTIECTPIMIDGVLFITTANRRVFALDAATGKEIWSFDPPESKYPLASGGVNRGVAYWRDGSDSGVARIFHGTSDGRLFSLDARTGELDQKFGTGGVKDLREDLEPHVQDLSYGPTSAPAICRDRVVMGFSCGEGPGIAAPGDIRAFDARTGKQAWRFHTVPRPGEHGNNTWAGDSWKMRGGANAWGGLSVDEKRGWVFAGLGSASFDFYGGDRKGENLFANCVIALDGETGKRIWHYQTIHHDLWDHDLPTYPNLVTLKKDGREIEVAVQVTKQGYVFVLDRQTGNPIYPVVERKMPASNVPGEASWPTQPIPVKPPPFVKIEFTEDDITDISQEAHATVKEQWKKLVAGPSFTPPSLEGSVCIPGFHGGATWSGASYDPGSGRLFVNGNNVPNVVTLVPRESKDQEHSYGITGYNKFLDPQGYPAIKPPWGTLSSIDLRRGEIAWQEPLGEYAALKKAGIPKTGTENFGGTITTAGGLVFIGGSMDEKFHAFDAATGETLFEYQLSAGGYATPCTYRVNDRQYVVIAAGGAGKPGTRPGDAFVAFALPREE